MPASLRATAATEDSCSGSLMRSKPNCYRGILKSEYRISEVDQFLFGQSEDWVWSRVDTYTRGTLYMLPNREMQVSFVRLLRKLQSPKRCFILEAKRPLPLGVDYSVSSCDRERPNPPPLCFVSLAISSEIEGMGSVLTSAAVARRDAGSEPPGMGSRRAAEVSTDPMSGTPL